MAEAHAFQHGQGVFLQLFAALAETETQPGAVLQFATKHDVFQGGQMVEYRVTLEHDATTVIRFAGQGLAIQQQFATAGLFGAQQ